MISLLGLFLFIGKNNVDAADQARNLYIQTRDWEYMIISSQNMYQFHIQFLIFSLIIYTTSSIFDIVFKYEKYKIKRIMFLVFIGLISSFVVLYLLSQTENSSIRDISSLAVTFYVLIVTSIGYFFESLMNKKAKAISDISMS